MPKISCKCGHVFDLITIPSPEGYSIVADDFLEQFGPGSTADDIVTAIDEQTPEMYKCSSCNRLLVFWERGNLKPTFFKEEQME